MEKDELLQETVTTEDEYLRKNHTTGQLEWSTISAESGKIDSIYIDKNTSKEKQVDITDKVANITTVARTGYDNNLIAHNNEFNFIPENYTGGDIYINYRADNDTTGTISRYVFCAGDKNYTGLASISNGQFSGNAASATSADITRTADTENGDQLQIGSGAAVNIANAVNAANVSGTINNKPINTIFEDDGITVKAATTAAKVGTSTAGTSIKPIYLDTGVPSECNTDGSTSGYMGFIPTVASTDGKLDIGQSINFHVNNSTTSYDAKLSVENTNELISATKIVMPELIIKNGDISYKISINSNGIISIE